MQGLLFHVAPVHPAEPEPAPLAGQLDLIDYANTPPPPALEWPAPVGALFSADDLTPGAEVLA